MSFDPQPAISVLQLRFSLRGLSPPVWRRVLVPEHLTLAQLHNVIQVVMGWTDEHLRFLAEMESVVPWHRLIAAVEPYYPKGKRGRPPIGLERMLRIYFLCAGQNWRDVVNERVIR